MTDLTALAERVEGLQAPCRETDGLVFKALVEEPGDVWCDDFDGWTRQDPDDAFMWELPPEFTASLDAVVALIGKKLPGARCEIVIGNDFSSARIVTGWGARKRVLAAPVERPDSHAAICAVAATLRALGESHDR